MGLFRLLLLVAIIAAAFWLWRKLTRKPQQPDATAVPMVRCAKCGVHLPREQALQQADHWYCSRAHLQQDQDSGGH